MDLELIFDAAQPELGFDLGLAGPDLAGDDGLRTAVLISLFTDRRAAEDDLAAGDATDRRGWWADAVSPIEGDAIGSRLWLLQREKLTDRVVARARGYAEEALAWLVEDGVAERVEVITERQGADRLAFEVLIHRPLDPPAQFRFDDFWRGQ